ncbi:RCC1/BLIP-II protein [Acrodontium crateriforme]|uniref:RCC1/BLIP-II protein n=1 Tax=Acrodontium crateriforme TaxID=150365 RepID=A0AAQ3M9T7_9PEZI|nr:RCC1/BLIP-II protein [Acrodontium crateriforme]
MLSRAAPRAMPRYTRASSTRAHFLARQNPQLRTATASYQYRANRKQQHLYRSLVVVALAGGAATLSQYVGNGPIAAESVEEPVDENPLVFEKSRKKPNASKEENRDLISSQHHQVKRSWENPGVYAWGNNSGRVVAPDSTESVIKTPRRIPFFDGMLLRDVKLDRDCGAAIDEKGNLLQWGTAYAADISAPVQTLKGKNLVALSISKDTILGLAKNGTVYSIPVSAEDQASGKKPVEASWIPFWSGQSPIAYRTILPKDLGRSEKVTAIAGGLEHALLLTSKGRLFSTASSSSNFPSRGQLGVPGLTWLTRPEGPYDQPHEITTLRGFPITKIASGDYHSLALDCEGRVFSWGDNSSGQLGFDVNSESTIVDAPSLLPTQKLYKGTSQVPVVTQIAAGGNNSYFTVDATKVATQLAIADDKSDRGLGRVTADTFAFGSGITGSLANNRWTHIQSSPTKIPLLSGLFEYDERTNQTVPIRLSHLKVGATHAAAVMNNITYLGASNKTSDDDTNWGADIVFWGGNEHFQLGTGKRNNVNSPTYIQPLDMPAEIERAKKSSGVKEEHRFHITPRTTATLGDGRRVSVEQRVECGRGVTCVYSGS